MAATELVDVVTTEPITVDVGSVESALSDIWRKAAEGSIPGTTTPLNRVLLLNLIVYAATDAQADQAKDIITEIAADYPARAVIADAEQRETEHAMEANVSMLCSIGERGRRLCGEEIRLHAHGLESAILGNMLPILAPDLPTYLWTPGKLSSDATIRGLVYVSDEWIIDTRHIGKWTAALDTATALCRARGNGIALHDLAWASVADWREVIAGLFDPASTRQYLSGIDSVEIDFARTSDVRPRAEAIMLSGWLMQRLGWQYRGLGKEAGDVWIIRAEHDGRAITIKLHPKAGNGAVILAARLSSLLDKDQGTFSAMRVKKTDEVRVETRLPDSTNTSHTVSVPFPTPCISLCRTLNVPGRDKLYDDSFELIQALMEGIESQVKDEC